MKADALVAIIIASNVAMMVGCESETPATTAGQSLEQPVPTPQSPQPAAAGAQFDDPFAERIGEVAIFPMDVPGFGALDLKSKQLVYQLFKVTSYADALYYAQRGRPYPYIRRMLRHIAEVKGGVPGMIIGKIKGYAREFWLYRGNHNLFNGERLKPMFIPGEFAAAAEASIRAGADLGQSELREVDLGATRLDELIALLNLVRPAMFDENPDATLYAVDEEQVTLANLSLANHLELAAPLLEAGVREAVSGLAAGLKDETKPLKSFSGWNGRLPNVAALWKVSPKANSGAPKTLKSFQVVLKDEALSDMLSLLAVRPGEFEYEMPGEKRFNRAVDSVEVPLPVVYRVVASAGETAVHLPARSLILDQGRGWPDAYIYFANSAGALLSDIKLKSMGHFSSSSKVMKRLETWHEQVRFVFRGLKEIIAPKSGKRSVVLQRLAEGTPEARAAQVIEMLHGDLVALHLAFGKRLRDQGLIPSEECAKAMVDNYVLSLPVQLATGAPPRSPAMTAKATVLGYALEKKSLDGILLSGGASFEIKDYKLLRNTVAELLGEVRSIRARADLSALNTLIDKYRGLAINHIESAPADKSKLFALPTYVAPGYPLFIPEYDQDGTLGDVEMVRYSSILEQEKVRATLL